MPRLSHRSRKPAIDPESIRPLIRPTVPRGCIYPSVLDLVGGTPLVRLPRLKQVDGLRANLALKLEFFNPLGSMKDRIGLAMVEAAERTGEITPGKTTIIEPTSGNTGFALAFVAAAKSYGLIVVMPEGASIERRKMLRLMGAQVETIPAKLGTPGAIARADAILTRTKDARVAR
jgi:cysteine synthase